MQGQTLINIISQTCSSNKLLKYSAPPCVII